MRTIILLLLPVVSLAPRVSHGQPLTQERAVAMALGNHAGLASLVADRDAAAARAEAFGGWIQQNPEIDVGVGPRWGGAETSVDIEASVSQTLEIFGQRSARLQAAQASLSAAEAQLEAGRARLVAEVRTAFARVLGAEALLRIAQESVELSQQVSRAAERRFGAGDSTRIELNSARVEVGRAAKELSVALRDRARAYAELELLLGRDDSAGLSLAGTLTATPAAPRSSEDPLARALASRRDLEAARRALDAARSELRLTEVEWAPRPTIGARYAREQGENIVLGTLGLELPVFQQNQAARASAHGEVVKAERNVVAVERLIRQESRVAADRLDGARRTLQAYGADVIGALDENLRLVTTAYDAGKVGLFELLVIRRDTLDARRGYVEAQEEYAAAEAELTRVIGAAFEPLGRNEK